jgi:hypothetical protein
MAILSMEHLIGDPKGTLIEGATGQGGVVLQRIERLLEERQIPKLKVQRKSVSPGMIQHMFGGKRPFLIISNKMGQNVQPCKVYVNARDFGVYLQVTWYMVRQPGLAEILTTFLMNIPILGFLLLPGYAIARMSSSNKSGILGFSIFDQQDLGGFSSTVDMAINDAIQGLVNEEEVRVDFPMENRESRGFTNISS